MRGAPWAMLCAALAGACGEEGAVRVEAHDARVATPLIGHGAWQLVPAHEDPLASHRPAQTSCPQGAYREEAGALEVQTGYCNYLALAQPLPVDIAKGDALRIVVVHDRLVSEPAQGHIALLLAGEVVWERSVEIPCEAASYDETFRAPGAVSRDEKLGLHLHNHGYNTWSLLAVERLSRL